MTKCPNCGHELSANDRFCFNCGSAVPVVTEQPVSTDEAAADEAVAEPAADIHETVSESVPEAEPEQETDNAPACSQAEAEPARSAYAAPAPEPAPLPPVIIQQQNAARTTLNAFEYIMLMLLFSLPVIGLIFLFVWGCGKPANYSKKQFALAILIIRLVALILVLASAVVCVILLYTNPEILEQAGLRLGNLLEYLASLS